MRAFGACALVLGVLVHGCTDECTSLAPAFQLDIHAKGGAGSLEVVLEIGDERRARLFNLEGVLDDGETSIAIELDPAVTGKFDVDVNATAYSELDGRGSVLGAAQHRFTGTPDGCNHFSLDLDDVDLDPDAGVLDRGVPDVGPADACNPTCDSAECDSTCGAGCAACKLSCAGATTLCNAVCQESSTCTIDCAGVPECLPSCSGTSSCEVDCAGTAECKARCVGQATCRLSCSGATECSFTACEGAQTTCADGSIVCDRNCP